jgi:hypothetical protein
MIFFLFFKDKKGCEETLKLVGDWIGVLTESCSDENPEDLHLSCARVLSNNATLLLADPDCCLGKMILDL